MCRSVFLSKMPFYFWFTQAPMIPNRAQEVDSHLNAEMDVRVVIFVLSADSPC